MNDKERRDYNKIYYLKNKEKINERKRLRYENDSEYRSKVKANALGRFKENRAKNKSEPRISGLRAFEENPFQRRGVKYAKINGRMVVLRNSSELAKSISVTSNTVKNWHEKNVLPEPLFIDANGRYWYDNDYIESIRKAIILRDSRNEKGLSKLRDIIVEVFKGE